MCRRFQFPFTFYKMQLKILDYIVHFFHYGMKNGACHLLASFSLFYCKLRLFEGKWRGTNIMAVSVCHMNQWL